MEQYKAYLSDVGNIGTRYATLQGFYVSVISVLMGILALTESPKLMGGIPLRTMAVACAFSSVLCWLWFLTIRYYQRLFLAKITVLKKIEEYLPLDCFAMEWAELNKPGSKRPVLLRIEKWLPLALIFLFVVLLIVRLA